MSLRSLPSLNVALALRIQAIKTNTPIKAPIEPTNRLICFFDIKHLLLRYFNYKDEVTRKSNYL